MRLSWTRRSLSDVWLTHQSDQSEPGPPEQLVSCFKPIPIWSLTFDPWQPNQLSIEALKSVHQHRAVGFMQHILTDFNPIIRPNSDQMRVKRGVMKRAQRDSIRNGGRSTFVTIADDVRSFEKLITFESADRAVTLIRIEHVLAKLLLVQALLHESRRINRSPADRHRSGSSSM